MLERVRPYVRCVYACLCVNTRTTMIFALFCVAWLLCTCRCSDISAERENHRPLELSDSQLHRLALMGNVSHIDWILDKILVPRVVGTKNHKRVRMFIIDELRSLNWTVDTDEFEDVTPNFGKLQFTNVIGTWRPDAKRFLALACHYDSKYTREGDFVGATDSAVPCAMLLNLAAQLRKPLQSTAQPDIGVKLIFFDGEEAFRQWGPDDSIYGARHLAREWERQRTTVRGETLSALQRLDVLVLLDLLGTPDPQFYSYFRDTERWYVRLARAEQRLAELGRLRQYSRGRPQQTYFAQRSLRAHIEDDHVPFLRRGVPVLHVIPSPFPAVWHTPADDRRAVDMHTVENLNKIVRVFVAEYLHLRDL